MSVKIAQHSTGAMVIPVTGINTKSRLSLNVLAFSPFPVQTTFVFFESIH